MIGQEQTGAAKEPAKLMVFWDYDTQWGADLSRMPGGPKKWGSLEFENTDRLLALHADYDVPACFAVVGSAALRGERPYHDPDQIRRIHEAGHEVGSHSHRHEWLPGLSTQALRETIHASKEALEQCIGAPVRSFVPPWNQPFDYPGGWSFSLAERREVPDNRNDLRAVCEALAEVGYRYCRVAYRPVTARLAGWLSGRRIDRPGRLEKIAGITCVRLNTPGGFGQPAVLMLDRCVSSGGLVVVYGHPHSLGNDDSQGEATLVPFLERVARLRREGAVRVCVPREMEKAT